MKAIFRIGIFLVASAHLGCNQLKNISDPQPEPPVIEPPVSEFTSTIKKFSSCDELKTFTSLVAPKSFIQSNLAAIPAMQIPPTYDNQSERIDEGDRVQKNSQFLFVLRDETLEILKRDTLKFFKKITMPNARRSLLFVTENFVFVISDVGYNRTRLLVLNTINFNIENQLDIAGIYQEVRSYNGHLILFTADYEISAILNSTNVLTPECQNIYYPQTNSANTITTSIYSFSLNAPHERPIITGLLGTSSITYMTENGIYLLSNSVDTSTAYLRKISWNEKEITLSAVSSYPGSVKDRWSVNEVRHSNRLTLTMATTLNVYSSPPGQLPGAPTEQFGKTHRLVSFEEAQGQFSIVSESKDFGNSHLIESVRFVNDLAYVMTSSKTNPLLIFYIGESTPIEQLGQLMVPGISSQLRPLSPNDLLGFGVGDTSQLQLSLFDVTNSFAPTLTNTFTFGPHGMDSEATHNSHSLMYDSGTGTIAFPAPEQSYLIDPNPSLLRPESKSMGAYVFHYQSGSITQIGRISHFKWGRSSYGNPLRNNISRLLVIDGRLISVSDLGVMAHNPRTLEVTSEQPF